MASFQRTLELPSYLRVARFVELRLRKLGRKIPAKTVSLVQVLFPEMDGLAAA